MREGREHELLVIDGQFIGINLGADYCAEHEWGIKGIQSKLGIDTTKLGLDNRKVSQNNADLHWLAKFVVQTEKKDKKLWSGIYFSHIYEGEKPYIGANAYGRDLITLWDEGTFCALSNDPIKISQLKEVYTAFTSNDIAIWRGGGGPFKNSGLCIAIASRLPKNITDGWYQHDVDHQQLMSDFRATGLEKKLKEAGKGYFALSPRREKDGSLMFWLNPTEQNKNNYGWYNVEQLEQWVRNEGPIPKGGNQKK